MRIVVTSIIRGIYYALLQPSELVSVPNRHTDRSLLEKGRQAWSLTIVYLVNLALFAGPLTLAGIGIRSESSLPGWLTRIVGTDLSLPMLYVAGFIQNSVYLLGFTVATLVAIHIALVITFQSKGFLRTSYSVVYSTSAYLAGMFTIVWYLTTASGVSAARDFIVDLQVSFIYVMIDYSGTDLQYSVPRPESLSVGEFSTQGEYAIIVLSLLLGYYFYSLYLGARLNHDADRIAGIVTVVVVICLPVTYVLGSIIIAA